MNRGEIWLVDLNPTIGAEMNKTRPALIMNDNRLGKLPLKIIIPITGWKEHYSIAPWMEKIGVITSDEIKVQDGILKVLGI